MLNGIGYTIISIQTAVAYEQDIFTWCDEHCSGKSYFSQDGMNFESKEDAMAFVLAFGG